MNCRQCGCEMHEYTQTGFTRTSSTGITVTRPDRDFVTCKNPDCDSHGNYNLSWQTLDKGEYPTMSFEKYLKPELREQQEEMQS